MSTTEMETRMANLESQMVELRRKIENGSVDLRPWWQQIMGRFADDPDYDEAMRLGREYRESLRPTDEGGDSDDNS